MGICEELTSIDPKLPEGIIKALALKICKKYPNTAVSWSTTDSVVIDKNGDPWYFFNSKSVPTKMNAYILNGVVNRKKFRVIPIIEHELVKTVTKQAKMRQLIRKGVFNATN